MSPLQADSMLSIDLSRSWTNSSVTIHSITKPDGAPNLNSASLWYHDSAGLLYSGYTGSSSSWSIDKLPPLPPLSLWTFKPDETGSGTWAELFNSNASVWPSTTRPHNAYMAYGNSFAYILGGEDSGDTPGHTGNTLPGMIEFDMNSQKFANASSESGATGPRGKISQAGGMEYVPFFGPGGLFIVMGGGDSTGLIDFGTVMVFDPAGGAWYNQTTLGDKPAPRLAFCTAGLASSSETHEMLVPLPTHIANIGSCNLSSFDIY